jgi:uncharacterized protein (TIRG00374 family)
VRHAALLAFNLILGTALLVWLLHRHGGTALEVLGRDIHPGQLVAFVLTLGLILLCFAWRWRLLLASLGSSVGLWRLALYRAAGQSLGALLPSARIGGDPLRAWLATRDGVPGSHAIASVATDRVLEIGAAVPFSIGFAAVLMQQGVPGLERSAAAVVVGLVALLVSLIYTRRRLQSGRGLVSAFVRKTGLDRIDSVRSRMGLLEASETSGAELSQHSALLRAGFAVGVLAGLGVIVEFRLLLGAFGLPSDLVSVAAAIFATAAAHHVPVPAGLGVLEGAMLWLFTSLGHPPEVALAVGLAVRLRELVWAAPGLIYLARELGFRQWPEELPTSS